MVAVNVSVNPSVKGTTDAIAQVGQDLSAASGARIPYGNPGDSLDGFRATYWIDPTSHLPVRSVGHVVISPADHRGLFARRFETTCQFGGQPKWNSAPVK